MLPGMDAQLAGLIGGPTFVEAGFVTSSFNGASASSYSFSSMSIGAAPTGSNRRFVVVTVESVSGNNLRNFTTGTIGGTGATVLGTRADDGSGSTAVATIMYLEVNSGTTATIVANFDSTMAGCNIGIYRLITGANGIATPAVDFESIGDVSTFNLNVATGSFVVATGAAISGGAGTWTELTEDYDTDLSINDFGSGASKVADAPAEPLTFTRTVTSTTEHAGVAGEFRAAA